jgi:hypothetical protein
MKRCSLGLLITLGIAAACTAQAQSPPPAPALAAPAPIYQDRVIEGLQPVSGDDDSAAATTYDDKGWARQMRLETRISQDSFTPGGRRSSGGVALYGLIETPNHGVLSVDGQFGSNPSGGSLTLRQRGLPLDGGWFANNEVGVISSLVPALSRFPSRVYVPGYLLEGAATEWINSGQGLQLQASTGSPGRLDGTLVGHFQRLTGTVTSLGAQVDQAPWSFAARVAQAADVALTDDPGLSGGSFDARSAQLSVRHDTGRQTLQANFVTSHTSVLEKTRHGVWIDGETRDGQRTHSAGLFWLEPDLSWAGQPMANDLAGAYIRSTWQSRQWSAEGSLDLLRSITNPSNTGAFINTSGRWRYSRSVSFGAGASVRSFNGNAWNTFAELRWQNAWGGTGLRLDLTTELAQSRRRQLTLDHDWQVATGWSLGTSVMAGRVSTPTEQQTLWGAAASVNAPVTSRVALRGNLTAENAGAGNSRTGVNMGLSWRLTPQWSLEGSYNQSRGQSRLNPSIDPLAAPSPFDATTSNSRSVFVALRWEERAGNRLAPLGGAPQEGGGRIEGTVFFDANRNGHQEANEGGAAGVTVFLDNRYPIRTDAQGRFEFPFVAAGPRTITIQNESLPLPWVSTGEGRTNVEVRVREDQRSMLGVVRQGLD